MKINNNYPTALQSRNKNQTYTNPAFKEHMIVHLERIPKEVVPDAISGIKGAIGEGLKEMTYKFGEETIPHNVFVGYGDKIIVGTGDSSLLKNSKEQRAKLKQIDIYIYREIRKVLKNLGIKKPDEKVLTGDFTTKTTGGIKELNNGKVIVRIEKNFDKNSNSLRPEYYLYNQDGNLERKILPTENVLAFS